MSSKHVEVMDCRKVVKQEDRMSIIDGLQMAVSNVIGYYGTDWVYSGEKEDNILEIQLITDKGNFDLILRPKKGSGVY